MTKLDKKAIQKYNDFMTKKYANRKDKENIYGVGLTDKEFVNFIVHIILGEDWYVVDSIGHNQVNEVAFERILDKLDKHWEEY